MNWFFLLTVVLFSFPRFRLFNLLHDNIYHNFFSYKSKAYEELYSWIIHFFNEQNNEKNTKFRRRVFDGSWQ